MSDHIPFDIQSDIIKRLPVKSLVQFRSVSKQWKAFIDDPKFIKTYHINHTKPQHHLLVTYILDYHVKTYTSIVDNNTFPKQKFSLTAPESFSSLRHLVTLSSADGLVCFSGLYGDVDLKTRKAVIWNPTIRKSVSILVIPKSGYERPIVGFGVCPYTSDPKLVTINVSKNKRPSMWVVDVFTLSTRVWKTVYMGAPFKTCCLTWLQAFVDGVIYFRVWDDIYLDDGVRSNFVISFDLKSEKFGEVSLPERLVHTSYLDVANVNESLGLLEYFNDGDISFCGVWTRKDGSNETFSKIYTVKVEGKSVLNRVLAFRNNGEVVMKMNDDKNEESRIEVHEPFSGYVNCVGFNGKQHILSARSYMETLLLLNESDSIIHLQR